MNRRILCALTCLLACIPLAGCNDTANSSSESIADITTTVTESAEPASTEPETEAATETTVTSTEPETTEATTVVTQEKTLLYDQIPDTPYDADSTSSPCGDISNAYVCIGGTAVSPGVYVLTADEVKKLANALNAFEWTEFPDKPVRPVTPSANDLTIYVNDNGRRFQLDTLNDTYEDENSKRYFMINPPSTLEEVFTLHDIASDLIINGDSKTVTTHIYMRDQLYQSEEGFDINKFWDLIWDDVIPYIEEGTELSSREP